MLSRLRPSYGTLLLASVMSYSLRLAFVFHTYSRNVSFLTRLVHLTHMVFCEKAATSQHCIRVHSVINFFSSRGFYFCTRIFFIRFVRMVALASISNTRLWFENICRSLIRNILCRL